MRRRTADRACAALLAVAAGFGCNNRAEVDPGRAATPDASAPSMEPALDDGSIDLTPMFRAGAIDTAGPVVDMGEAQSANWILGAPPLATETLNGDSWASIGARLRLRMPLDLGLTAEGSAPPRMVRFRVRRGASRGVAVIVDGLLMRTASLPATSAPTVMSFALPSEHFTRAEAELELRFAGIRAKPGAPTPVTAQVDWVQLAREEVAPTLVSNLLNDVAIGATPRRALTFYPPTVLSTVMVLPPHATWVASLAAEAPRGAVHAPRPVVALFRVEADGDAPLERRVEVTPQRPWQDVRVDLSAFAGRPTRLSLAAVENPEVRLAVAAPRLELPPAERPAAPDASGPSPVNRVFVLVVRGLRVDRLVPAVTARWQGGGFARMVREGTVAIATPASTRAWSSMLSVTTGLGADLHRAVELTDLIDDEAPSLLRVLNDRGVSTSCFSDDALWIGSGADRGCARRETCANGVLMCRPETLFPQVIELAAAPHGRGVVMFVTRAGAFPLDPSPEAITALDPTPYEGTMSPAQTTILGQRGSRGDVRLEPRDQERLGLLYDAALYPVDRALGTLLDRIHDGGLDGQSLVLVVGDRATALGENRAVGDGPSAVRNAGATVVLARGPGFAAGRRVAGVAGVVDVAATVLERLGIPVPDEMDGRSLAHPELLFDRVLPFVANARGELGARFGELVALPRSRAAGGGYSLVPYADEGDAVDVAPLRPIARAFAERSLALIQSGGTRRPLHLATRVLPVAPPLARH